RVEDHASVDCCVVMHNARIGRNAVLRNVILDKNVEVADGVQIGVDREADEARGFHVSTNGVTVVPKNAKVNPI
ncbi:MAG: glucose-1-phosphate adenylyltransferase, partial [Acidobacteriota bacterium]|nr:glucose-1-phosphate adenylyltransferase [Acidobacteriota bacterium]